MMSSFVRMHCRSVWVTQWFKDRSHPLHVPKWLWNDYAPFFSSVAHVWLPGAKTTWPIAKKFGFS
jgi:hypothetical protein